MKNGAALMVTQQVRIGIRGMAPGAKEEHELGWFGWSVARGISRDGHKIVFEEEGNGGGPNYTVFLRDTDGSPPTRIGEGLPRAISPDSKWVVTKPAKGGPAEPGADWSGRVEATYARLHQLWRGSVSAGRQTSAGFGN